jgi:hypothetical protein
MAEFPARAPNQVVRKFELTAFRDSGRWTKALYAVDARLGDEAHGKCRTVRVGGNDVRDGESN